MKKSHYIILAVACLVIGFIGGVLYASYSSPPPGLEGVSQRPTGMPSGMPPSAPETGPTAQQKAAVEAKVKEWQARMESAPDDPDLYVQAGNAMFDLQVYDQAVEYYEKAVELGKNDANVYTDIGVCYRRMGNPEKAVENFRQARKADPMHEISALNLGIVLLHDLNDQKGAIAAWKEYLKLNPTGQRADTIRQVIAKIEAEMGETQGK
jgi:tetratricopeptide (TPR) repeat protein